MIDPAAVIAACPAYGQVGVDPPSTCWKNGELRHICGRPATGPTWLCDRHKAQLRGWGPVRQALSRVVAA